jgi:hypothetical protein
VAQPGRRRPVHDRLGPHLGARSGRHRQRSRGQTRLIHGLPLQPAPRAAPHPTHRIPDIHPWREASPPRVDADGFTEVRGNRSSRRRRQRRAQHAHQPPAATPAATPRIPAVFSESASDASPPCSWWRHAQGRLRASAATIFGTWLGTVRSLESNTVGSVIVGARHLHPPCRKLRVAPAHLGRSVAAGVRLPHRRPTTAELADPPPRHHHPRLFDTATLVAAAFPSRAWQDAGEHRRAPHTPPGASPSILCRALLRWRRLGR